MMSKAFIVLWTILCIAGFAYHLWNLEGFQPLLYAEMDKFGIEVKYLKQVSPMSYVTAAGLWLLIWNLFVVPTALIGLLFGKEWRRATDGGSRTR